MYSKKKKDGKKSSSGKGQALMEQMGLFPGMGPGGMDMDNLDDDDDADLEAELLALQGESSPKKEKAKGKKIVSAHELDRMVAASMRDVGSDEEMSDTEDPDLLAELRELADDSPEPPPVVAPPAPTKTSSGGGGSGGNQVALVTERLEMYMSAEANAKSAGDSSKARRMGRGVKTLQDLLKKAKAGRTIPEDDLPPPVATGGSSKSSSQKTTPEDETPQTVYQAPSQPSQAVKQVQRESPPRQMFEPTTASRGYAPPTEPPASRPASLVPPQASVGARQSSPATQRSAPSAPANISETSSDPEKIQFLLARRDQYKSAALTAKHGGDNGTAVKFIRIAKQFDQVIEAIQQGKPVDLSRMPPPPPGTATASVTVSAVPAVRQTERSAMQASADPSPEIEIPEISDEAKKNLYKAPETAGSTLEALQQRLAKYKSSEAEAKEQSNTSKARRMGRITKQYEDAIKAFKAGRTIDYDDLPCPPGFPPIPMGKTPSASPAATPSAGPAAPAPTAISGGAPAPTAQKRAAVGPPPVQQKPKFNRQLSAMSRAEQQAIFLQERQLQFKKAALEAKRKGDMELAKKYIRFAKGFDQMIEASNSGLPVDMSQVPPPPSSEESFEFVEADTVSGDRDEIYKKLEQELIEQIRTCGSNADNFTHLGDVSSATKFDQMGKNCRKDLDALKNAYKHGDPVPRFHYENRQFSMVKSCNDLGDNDLEIHILRGINYGLPSGYTAKDLDTYVKFEFPFPNDDPQCGHTDTAKHTANPEYNQTFKLEINRKSRSFMRLLKSSKQLKLEIYYKRGFLKGDKLLGSASMKLQSLENQCIIHESVDLMDGRKASGGKIEFKVRVRNPFVSKQVEEIKEKWLVIDRFERAVKPEAIRAAPVNKPVSSVNKPAASQVRPAAQKAPAPPPPAPVMTSMEVLKYEKQLLDQQIRKYQGRLNKADEDSLRHKGELIVRQIEDTKKKLQAGGPNAYKVYANAIEKTQNSYVQEAKALVQSGNRDKAQVALNKKRMVEREVEAIRAKVGS